MDALHLLAECAARDVLLEPRGAKLGIQGPRAAVAELRPAIVQHKIRLLHLLRGEDDRAGGCARCAAPATRTSTDDVCWCRRCDARRYCLDLAIAADCPRVNLRPMLLVVPTGSGPWSEFARSVAGATLYVAIRHLRALMGDAAEAVEPSNSPLDPWQSA